MVDNILIGLNDSATTAELKGAWGLPNVTHDNDFARLISIGLESWQGKNWDPANNDQTFDYWCGNITSSSVLYSQTANLRTKVQKLLYKGGYAHEIGQLTTPFLNWIGWLKQYTVAYCRGDQDACYSTHDPTFFRQDDISQTWRAWPYQVSSSFPYSHQCPNKLGLHTMGLPPDRIRRASRPTSPRLSHQRSSLPIPPLPIRLQHLHSSQCDRHQQIRRLRPLLPTSRHD